MTGEQAAVLAPAKTIYQGVMTTPGRWATWQPRHGDIVVCTPPKCGTTWTQTIVAMLIHAKSSLPESLHMLSPWVDSAFGDAQDVKRSLAAQSGRRVVKTHTPADGFPVWEGVSVVAVYRHPLDTFFSLRKHVVNRRAAPDHPLRQPLDAALATFLSSELDLNDFDTDSLATIARHFRATVLDQRRPDLILLHYADMIADPRSAVRRIAEGIGVDVESALLDAVVDATAISTMRANADRFVPEGGKGFFESDAGFFDSGGTEKWRGQLSDADLKRYTARLVELVPEERARKWLESGGRDGPSA